MFFKYIFVAGVAITLAAMIARYKEPAQEVACPGYGFQSFVMPKATLGYKSTDLREKIRIEQLARQIAELSDLHEHKVEGQDGIYKSFNPVDPSEPCGVTIKLSYDNQTCHSISVIERTGVWQPNSIALYERIKSVLEKKLEEPVYVLMPPNTNDNYDYRQAHPDWENPDLAQVNVFCSG
ncbi:MAG: hypothetical protein ACJAR0_004600 [Candidatus Azotimanducaceae bacterium]